MKATHTMTSQPAPTACMIHLLIGLVDTELGMELVAPGAAPAAHGVAIMGLGLVLAVPGVALVAHGAADTIPGAVLVVPGVGLAAHGVADIAHGLARAVPGVVVSLGLARYLQILRSFPASWLEKAQMPEFQTQRLLIFCKISNP